MKYFYIDDVELPVRVSDFMMRVLRRNSLNHIQINNICKSGVSVTKKLPNAANHNYRQVFCQRQIALIEPSKIFTNSGLGSRNK
jgi:hypothetical protein